MYSRLAVLVLPVSLTACLAADEADEPTSDGTHMQDLEERPDIDVDPPDTVDPEPTLVIVEPPALDLGTIDPRCPLELDVTLTASGDDSPGQLTVEAPEGWTVTVESAELNTGESSTAHLSWVGTNGDPSGELVFDFAGHESITVPVWALPELPSESLTLDLTKRAEADLLLAVDRSCNMDDMARLEPHWPTLRSQLAEAGIQLRMASVVEDDGCVRGDPLILDDSLDDDAFRAALWAQQRWTENWYSVYSEKLLALSSIALTGGCNAELVQGSAPLHVLAFSDEPDQSDEEWSVYVDQMAELTDPGVPFTVHGIGGTGSTECWAQYYEGVMDAAAATGGVFLDFCTDDWAEALTELADGMAEASRRVVLSTLPEVEGELIAVHTEEAELTRWSLENGLLLLPSDTDFSGELTLEFRSPPICGD